MATPWREINPFSPVRNSTLASKSTECNELIDRGWLVETVYEDVGKLDPESRIATIKETMDKWIEDAKAKAPCCLILDDLDNLLSPETEVSVSQQLLTFPLPPTRISSSLELIIFALSAIS